MKTILLILIAFATLASEAELAAAKAKVEAAAKISNNAHYEYWELQKRVYQQGNYKRINTLHLNPKIPEQRREEQEIQHEWNDLISRVEDLIKMGDNVDNKTAGFNSYAMEEVLTKLMKRRSKFAKYLGDAKADEAKAAEPKSDEAVTIKPKRTMTVIVNGEEKVIDLDK